MKSGRSLGMSPFGSSMDGRRDTLARRFAVSMSRSDRPGGRTVVILPGASVSRPHMGRCRPMADQPLAARRTLRGVGVAAVALLVVAGPVAGHGEVPSAPPDAGSLLLGWTFPTLPTLAILAAIVWWRWAVRRVNAAHPANPVPRRR